ncbi:RTA1 like protein-domain-containing protein [Roridomyces roridus]|uniref:RTA1 like protein-domain-containing protein n=1 Tax=Roridomyces roridus TaxID=1738132 RepID=A0AAD7BAT3_9AGAR|nr:RTA1 like protein-domain-containing protein [Roridomyces roridus]
MPNHILRSLLLFSGLISTVLAATSTDHPIGGFIPKKGPAVIALALYGLSAVVLWIHYFRFGRPSFMTTLTVGMTGMTIGFVMRIIFSNSPNNLTLYIVEDLFILLSPCAFLATDYVLLARLTSTFDAHVISSTLLVRPALIVRIFVWSDVVTFLIQAGGGSMSTSHNINTGKLGTKISMVGLVLQLLSFLFFVCLLIVFGWRLQTRFPGLWNAPQQDRTPFKVLGKEPSRNWHLLYWTMCLTCVGILVRSVFRIAEFAGGYNGYLADHEGYFYIFDSLTLWVSMTLYCFVWPTRFMEPHTEGAGPGIKMVVQGEGSREFLNV